MGAKAPKMTGDFQVLHETVGKGRAAVQKARVDLATKLDQLGEHHVRQQEYDEAMDAFTEALREKRSVFWQVSPSADARSSHSSWFGSDCDSSLGGDNTDPSDVNDRAIDEIVNTLRSMGNVHSLRGEQDEAMRYYTEVTNLRAQKSSNIPVEPSSIGGAGDNKSSLSGLNDDTSTLMSEINEDVKALDDLFRSISFRNQSNSNNNTSSTKHNSNSTDSIIVGTEKRKSKLCQSTSQNSASSSNKRLKSSSDTQSIAENEPFKRSTSALCLPANGNEVAEAIEMYNSVLCDSYEGQHLRRHKEMLNSLALRADLLSEQARNKSSTATADSSSSTCLLPTEKSPSRDALTKAAELELALEVYQQILMVHEEQNHRISQSESSASSSSSISSSTSSSSDGSTTPEMKAASSNIASTLICMGSIYYKLGNRVEELRMYQEAKAVYRRAFGENHTFVAGTRKNIGMVLAERGEYEEAMKQFDKAMKIYMVVGEKESKDADGDATRSRDVASAISCMGNVNNRVGDLDAALGQYMQALTIYKTIHEENEANAMLDNASSHNNEPDSLRDVTSTLKVIGMVHAKKGDLDTAMEFFQEAMALLRSYSVSHSTGSSAVRETTASVLTRIASIHLKKGDLEQAMGHYKEAYDLTVRNRGTTNHQEVAGILHYIGGIYHKRADYEEAMACYQEAIRIYHSTLGPGNPTVAGTLVMVGSIYYKRRNLDSAMMFYREALRLNRDAYGVHHPDVAPILKSIGTILTKKGDYREAYDIFRDVLSIKCTVHGTDHPEVASAYKSLGNVHYKLGDLADAERQYRHALSIYRRTKGEDHPDTVAAKTTIEHLKYWMKEREQRQLEQRNTKNACRRGGGQSDERSC